MRLDNLDHILSEEEEILPSSGFLSSVMEDVRREAATPPPIPFPWRRALPGLIIACLTIVLTLVAGLVPMIGGVRLPPLEPAATFKFGPVIEAAKRVGADWIILVLLLALASVKFSMRLAGTRG